MHYQPVCRFPRSEAFMDAPFEMEGRIVELLRGCGTAVVAGESQEVSLNRGTDGVQFEQLYLGQTLVCTVTGRNKRVLFAQPKGSG